MENKEFAIAALDSEYEIFVVYIASLNSIPLINICVHLSYRPKIAGLIARNIL